MVADQLLDSADMEDRQFVTALARGLCVLRAFRPGDGVLGNGDLAERTGLPKPTVSRLTHTLTRLGYLIHAERLGKYRLGPGVLSLGYSLLANMDIRKIARPYLREFANASGLALALGARDRLNMVYLEHARDAGSVTLRLDIGSHVPVATSAMGRAFLAAIPEIERQYLMDAIKARAGDEWPRLRRGIEQSVRQVAEHGFCTSFGDWEGGPGTEMAEVLDAGHFKYLRLNFKDDVLVGALSLGRTDHMGVLRGLIQNRTHLGPWKAKLMEDPHRIMEAYVAHAYA